MLLYFPADAATMKGALVRILLEVGVLAAVEGCRVDGSLLVFPHKALMIGALLCAGRGCNSRNESMESPTWGGHYFGNSFRGLRKRPHGAAIVA